ncbi:hypothetical protein [Stenotrophomonas maltophilia]|uniref:hypothetical protein n=1 Tax=Stenotrophomonas maltophilia TaxID=40324 RepID=UPI002A95B235|nr:hypothetical protein [Stenotrophomonas maltophilia]
MDKATYSWSFDEETYHGQFGSIEEAMKAAFDREVRTADAGELRPGVHIGEQEPLLPTSVIHAEALIEWARDQMLDQIGEAAEIFLESVTPAQKIRLDAFLNDWIRLVDGNTSYWTIINSAFHRFADYGLRQEAE